MEVLLIFAVAIVLLVVLINQGAKSMDIDNQKRSAISVQVDLTMGLRRYFLETELPPTDYTVIDTETTGLDAKTCEILEIGAIKYRDHMEVSRYHTYVKPIGPLSREAMSINHITQRDVASGKTVDESVDGLKEFIGDDVIIGYNVGFDIKFIQTRTQEDLMQSAFDVLSFAKEVVPGLPSYKLADLKEMYDIPGKSHSALDDCATTAAVYKQLLDTHEGRLLYDERIQKEAQYKAAYKRLSDTLVDFQSLPPWQIQKYVQSMIEVEEHEKRYNELRNKKNELRKTIPPMRELRAISAQMAGSGTDYLEIVCNILHQAGLCEEIPVKSAPQDYYDSEPRETRCVGDSIYYGPKEFFHVKLDGNLKYIVLNVPPDTVVCDYIVTPTSMAEGVDSSRFYIPSPDALEEIKNYVIESFNLTKESCEV